MRAMRHMLARLIAWLIGVAAVLAVAVTAFVYSGQEHREAVTSIAREFFVFVEKASRAKSPFVNASSSPTQERGIIK
jgi:hypothetical protein